MASGTTEGRRAPRPDDRAPGRRPGAPGGTAGTGRTRRLLSAVGLALVLALTGTGLQASPAAAYPSKDKVSAAKKKAAASAASAAATKRKLGAAQSRLDVLNARAETAIEAYNGALFRLGKARKAYRTAQQRAREGERSVERARRKVAAVAATAYESGGMSGYVTLVGADDPTAVEQSAGSLHALSTQADGTLARLRAARIVQDVLRGQAATALSAQRRETARVKKAEQAAKADVAAQQGVLDKVASLERRLAAVAGSDASSASHLADQRAAGIAAAKAAAARAAARAAAEARRKAREAALAQQNHHSSGGGHHASGGGGGGGGGGGRHHSSGHSGGGPVQFAYAQLGKWYVWGADGPSTYDCSGLTMRAWQQAGVSLPHWSVGQWYATQRVSMSNLRPGDLIFYANNTSSPSSIHHVTMYIGGGRMIEAPHTGAQVRISSIWRPGLIGAGRP